MISKAVFPNTYDGVLGVPHLNVARTVKGRLDLIVGLPSLSPKRFYVVPVEDDGENAIKLGTRKNTRYLFVDWPIQFL